MDPDEVVKVRLARVELERDAEALDDLASVPPEVVHAHDPLLVRLVADDLCIIYV